MDKNLKPMITLILFTSPISRKLTYHPDDFFAALIGLCGRSKRGFQIAPHPDWLVHPMTSAEASQRFPERTVPLSERTGTGTAWHWRLSRSDDEGLGSSRAAGDSGVSEAPSPSEGRHCAGHSGCQCGTDHHDGMVSADSDSGVTDGPTESLCHSGTVELSFISYIKCVRILNEE